MRTNLMDSGRDGGEQRGTDGTAGNRSGLERVGMVAEGNRRKSKGIRDQGVHLRQCQVDY